MLKKSLALLLGLLMLLTMLPAAAAAESDAAAETPEGKKPFVKSSESQMIFSSEELKIGTNEFTIAEGNDVVFRPFTPHETKQFTVCSIGDDDTCGYILDSNYSEIAFNDDGGDGRNFSMDYTLIEEQTYYIGARFYEPDKTGTISVVISCNDMEPYEGTVEWNTEDVQFKGSTPYVVANGSAQTPRFTVKDADGNVVDESKYTYYYRENVNAGTGYVCVLIQDTSMLRSWFKIYLPATSKTFVENTDDGIRITWTPVPGADGYVIYRRAWSTTTNGWTDFSRWDNTSETFYIDGIDASHKVYAGTRYQYGVKAYFHRREDPVSGAEIGGNVGDNFNLGMVGPLKTTVRITSRELTKVIGGSRKITAYWTPSKNFTGYHLQYATDAAFTKNLKTITIKDAKVSSKMISSLTNSKQYYVRIRSYQEFEGMTYYGAWSNPLWMTAGRAETMIPMRAVLVGENKYPDNELRGCVNDIYAMSGMLRNLKYPYYTKTLPNAGKDDILNAIRTQFKNTTNSDVSLFYFSGHGRDADGDATYLGALVSVDSEYITFAELAAELNKVKGHVIVILDSCYSGAAIGRGQSSFDPEAFNRAAIEAFSGYTLEEEAGERSGELRKNKFIVITATHSRQGSEEGYYNNNDYRQGAFTAALLQGMGCSYPFGEYSGSMPADVNRNKSITLKELFDYAYSTVLDWTSSSDDPPQQVQYFGTDSTVLFAR